MTIDGCDTVFWKKLYKKLLIKLTLIKSNKTFVYFSNVSY